MLAQSFKSSADLGITEPQLSALQKTLVLLETDKLSHFSRSNLIESDRQEAWIIPSLRPYSGHFNMAAWSSSHPCGTACCIGGTAELVGKLPTYELDDATNDNSALHELFYPSGVGGLNYGLITPAQAATALRSYLTTGDARWDLAVAR